MKNFVDDSRKKLVVVKKGTKYPEVVNDTSKTSVSTIFYVSADRKILPPYTVYKAKHMYPTRIDGGLERAEYNRNENGWFNMSTFENWFVSCFFPSCRYFYEPKVIISNHLASHLSLEVNFVIKIIFNSYYFQQTQHININLSM